MIFLQEDISRIKKEWLNKTKVYILFSTIITAVEALGNSNCKVNGVISLPQFLLSWVSGMTGMVAFIGLLYFFSYKKPGIRYLGYVNIVLPIWTFILAYAYAKDIFDAITEHGVLYIFFPLAGLYAAIIYSLIQIWISSQELYKVNKFIQKNDK